MWHEKRPSSVVNHFILFVFLCVVIFILLPQYTDLQTCHGVKMGFAVCKSVVANSSAIWHMQAWKRATQKPQNRLSTHIQKTTKTTKSRVSFILCWATLQPWIICLKTRVNWDTLFRVIPEVQGGPTQNNVEPGLSKTWYCKGSIWII